MFLLNFISRKQDNIRFRSIKVKMKEGGRRKKEGGRKEERGGGGGGGFLLLPSYNHRIRDKKYIAR